MQNHSRNSDLISSSSITSASLDIHSSSYAKRLAAEINTYEECTNVHDLPPIFSYWSKRYLTPLFLQFGFDSPTSMFAKYLQKQCALSARNCRFISLGSGNCVTEVAVASQLRMKGYSHFVIECFDLNSKMLERGAQAAREAGVSANIGFHQGDLNEWRPAHEYDAVMADQSLHHVVQLEVLFDHVKNCLKAEGTFLISDMIGRNGHQRWPEALVLVHEFWRKLPPSYRYNRSLQRYEELYENWDCSLEGFEGIRSQDILPLLLERFPFHLFLGFSNIIDPFVDRAFGPNFDAESAWDRNFIDQVHLRDQQCLLAGKIKPTHMLAVLGKHHMAAPLVHRSLTPEFCVRAVEPAEAADIITNQQTPALPIRPYDGSTWPPVLHRELKFTLQLCEYDRGRYHECFQELSELQRTLAERTAWALRLDEEINARNQRIVELQKESAERTAWALRLDEEINARNQRIVELQKESAERTAWALSLTEEMKIRDAHSYELQKRLDKPLLMTVIRWLDRYKRAKSVVAAGLGVNRH